jgi:hypothetical protein
MPKPDEKLDDEGRELAAAMGVDEPSPEVEPGEEAAAKGTPPKAPGIEDEFRKFREEQESSRQAMEERINHLQNENAFYRTRLDEQRPREVSREEVEKEEPLPISEEEYYKNPVKASMVIADYVLRKQVTKAQQGQSKQYDDEMRMSYERGRDNAFKKYPELFKGIEGEVENTVYRAYKDRRITRPREMEDEGTWAFAGEINRRAQGELNFEKYYRPNPGATDPGFSETPSAGRTRGKSAPAVEWDDEAETMLEEINRGEKKPITKEEIHSMMATPPKSKRK